MACRQQEALSHRYVALVRALQADPAYAGWRSHAPEFERKTSEVLERLQQTHALMDRLHSLLDASSGVESTVLETLLDWTRDTTTTLYDSVQALKEELDGLRAQRGELPYDGVTTLN
ncbi:hypothetical protein DES52_10721 [Deinococcus yavapaiensis KR-236]|uniref:Uncharacterized protein n=2 Tax=Deinococcus TaxID=1298 RepID=A0A318S6C3_9DEIO|nr:hypothetical protein DES52_10721 [Deinococcus yavapaiensis KR-236]